MANLKDNLKLIWTPEYNIMFQPDNTRLLERHIVPQANKFPFRLA